MAVPVVARMCARVMVIVAIVSPRRPMVAVMPRFCVTPAMVVSLVPARAISPMLCMVPGAGVHTVLSPMVAVPVTLLFVLGSRPIVSTAFSVSGQGSGAAAHQGGAEE